MVGSRQSICPVGMTRGICSIAWVPGSVFLPLASASVSNSIPEVPMPSSADDRPRSDNDDDDRRSAGRSSASGEQRPGGRRSDGSPSGSRSRGDGRPSSRSDGARSGGGSRGSSSRSNTDGSSRSGGYRSDRGRSDGGRSDGARSNGGRSGGGYGGSSTRSGGRSSGGYSGSSNRASGGERREWSDDRSTRPRSGARDTRPIPPPPRRKSNDDRPAPMPARDAEVWIDEGPVNPRAPKQSASRRLGRPVKVHAPGLVELVGSKRAARLEGRLSDAATAYAAERYPDSRRILAPIVAEVPDLAEGRELYGLTLYRLGRWKDAARELDAFVDLSGGSTEQHPVLADCRRALGQYAAVDELWEELRSTSPSGPLVVEGRIVAAGALADQGRLAEAIALLGKGFRMPKDAMEHHLRRGYALADLYERSGDAPQARLLFAQVARAEPGFLDAAERAAG